MAANKRGSLIYKLIRKMVQEYSTNRAYLQPARDRTNLFGSMNTYVNKVLIDPERKTAYGVEFTKESEDIKVIAKKEVILCVGAINTPKLIMVSGIGPAEHLESLNITVLKDAPVGENLMDHIAYIGLTFLTNETESLTLLNTYALVYPTLGDYLNDRKGPLTLPGGIEGIAYVNFDDPSPNNETPNVELFLASITFGADYFAHVPFRITAGNFINSFGGILYRHAYFI